MRLETITNIYGQAYEVNLDLLAVIDKNYNTNEINITVGGYSITVTNTEFNRIMQLIEPKTNFTKALEVIDDVCLVTKIKELIYRSPALNSDAKLQLIMEIEKL